MGLGGLRAIGGIAWDRPPFGAKTGSMGSAHEVKGSVVLRKIWTALGPKVTKGERLRRGILTGNPSDIYLGTSLPPELHVLGRMLEEVAKPLRGTLSLISIAEHQGVPRALTAQLLSCHADLLSRLCALVDTVGAVVESDSMNDDLRMEFHQEVNTLFRLSRELLAVAGRSTRGMGQAGVDELEQQIESLRLDIEETLGSL